jgi:hypothetical protein
MVYILQKALSFEKWYYFRLDEEDFKDVTHTAEAIVQFLRENKFKGWK